MTRYADLGLPVGETSGTFGALAFDRLLFNATARTLVAVLRPLRIHNGVYQLFAREMHEERYRPLTLPEGATHVSDIAICGGSAVAFVILNAWRPVPLPGSDAYGIENLGVGRISLPNGSFSILPAAKGKPGSRRVWMSALLGIADDAHSYLAVVASERETDAGGAKVEYAIMKIDAASGESELVGDLAMPFA